jgi:transcriptional regulator with XRE-family HTH domain
MSRKIIEPIPNSSNIQIGKRLASIRKSCGFTQSQIAERIGVTQWVITSYEIGRAGISADVLARLCSVLKCSADTIIGLRQDSNAEIPNLRFIKRIKNIEQLPINQQKALLQTIDMFLKGAKRA